MALDLFGHMLATVFLLDVRSVFSRDAAFFEAISDPAEGIEGMEEQDPPREEAPSLFIVICW